MVPLHLFQFTVFIPHLKCTKHKTPLKNGIFFPSSPHLFRTTPRLPIIVQAVSNVVYSKNARPSRLSGAEIGRSERAPYRR